jgi:hypothetical protein
LIIFGLATILPSENPRIALQGCVIVALQGGVIVVLQDCVIVVLQGCVIVA